MNFTTTPSAALKVFINWTISLILSILNPTKKFKLDLFSPMPGLVILLFMFSGLTALAGERPVGPTNVVITEIMANPPETGTDSLEYIEIYNPTGAPVDMTGYYIGLGFSYTFGDFVLGTNEYVVLCKNSSALFNTLGISGIQWTSGTLSNGGETIALLDSTNQSIDFVNYSTGGSWPSGIEGTSIVLCDPNSDNSLGSNWQHSGQYQNLLIDGRPFRGSPGVEDVGCTSNVFYVNDNNTSGDIFTTGTGNDANPGTISQPFATIQYAEDQASSGDVIYVDAGTYNEDLLVNVADLTLQGAGVDQSIIDHTGQSGHNNAGVDLLANGVSMTGFTVTGNQASNTPRYGLKVGTSSVTTDNVVLEDIKVTNSYRTGFDLARPKNILLKNVIAENNDGAGIFMSNPDGATLQNITTNGNPWTGVSIATRHDWPGDATGVVFTGTNSFGENAGKNGGVQIESDETLPISWSNNLADGADVTIQQSELGYALSGPTTNSFTSGPITVTYAPYFRFYETLPQAESAAGSTPDHVDAPRYIRDADNSAGLPSTHFYVYDNTFMSIQAAVDAAVNGNTVNVFDGEFVEQVEITKDLTLTGQGQGVTIIKGFANMPLSYTTSLNNVAVVYVHNANNVIVENLTVDGDGQGNTNYRYQGVAYNDAGGRVQNVEVKSLRDTPLSGTQHGIGIFINATAGTARGVLVSKCMVYDFQKTGMSFSGANLVASADSNMVTGSGPLGSPLAAQNGIQFYGTNGGNITGNTVSDIRYTENTYVATGIITLHDVGSLNIANNVLSETEVGIYGQNNNTTVTDNSMDQGDYGLYIFAADGEATDMDAQNNFITNYDYGAVAFNGGSGTVNSTVQNNSITDYGSVAIAAFYDIDSVEAQCNWYGSSAPEDVYAGIYGQVIFEPFLTDGTDDSPTTGFQPLPGVCNGYIPCDTVYVNDTLQTGDIYTTTTGNDGNSGGPNDPFASIQYAVDHVCDGGVIIVDAGNYYEDLLVNRENISLLGAGIDQSIIDHTGQSGHNNAGVDLLANGVSMTGFTVTGNQASSTPRYGLKVGTSGVTTDDVVLEDVKVTNSFRTGFDLARPKDILLKNVIAENNGGAGIFMTNVEGAILENITTSGNPWTGVAVSTRDDWSGTSSGVFFTGTNSFAESNSDNGGVQLEMVPGKNISWSTDSTDGKEVTLLPTDFSYVLSGPTSNAPYDPYFRFYNSLPQAESASGGDPDHVDAPRYIRDADNSDGLPGTQFYVYDNDNMTVQAAINAAIDGNTVNVDAGTFEENVNVNKVLTVQGVDTVQTVIQGSGGTVVSMGAGSSATERNVLQKLRVTGGAIGISLSSFNTLSNVLSTSNTTDGARLTNLDDLLITHSCFNANGNNGIKIPSVISATNVVVDSSEFNNNKIGWYSDANSGTEPDLDMVSITNSSFNGNSVKGFYTERLSNALLENLTVTGSGAAASSYPAGIDLNLKWKDYANIILRNLNISGSGAGPNGTALAVKARNDASSYNSNPASLTGLVFDNNSIETPVFGSDTLTGLLMGNAISGITFTGVNNFTGTGNGFTNYMDPTGGDFSIDSSAFSGSLANYIKNFSLLNIDAMVTTFDGKIGDDMTKPEIQATEDKIFHKKDLAILGLVSFYTPCSDTLYVNDNDQSGDVYTSAVGDDANPGTAAAPFATINRALEMACDSAYIFVDAGVYEEEITLDSTYYIRGANYGINPNTGSRVAESIIYPGNSDPDPYSLTGVVIAYLNAGASGSQIDGFTIDGDNPNLTSGVVNNGADVDAIEAIASYEGVANVEITNNIIKQLSYTGIDLYNDANGGAATTGNLLDGNLFENILPAEFGIAVLIYNNCYTTISNNVMAEVRVGVQTGNFNKADPGNSHSIFNNQVEAGRIGIWHNLAYTDAANFEIFDNSVTKISGHPENLQGLKVSSLNSNVGITVMDNTVTGADVGLDLWNNPTTNLVTVGYNQFINCDTAIFANNYDGYSSNANSSSYIIDSVDIQNATVGILVKDNAANTNNATVAVEITGHTGLSGTNGLIVEGPDASVTFNGTEPAAFTGQTTYIELENNPVDINALEVLFDGKIGNDMTAAERQATEDKIYHQVDDPSLGLVTFFELCYDTLTVTSCDSFVSPSGNQTWMTSGQFNDTIAYTGQCDSIFTVNLTINNSNTGSETVTACDSYTWPTNGQTYTSSGTPMHTLTNQAGCDSVVTLNLTINQSTSSSITEFACDSLVSPSGNYTWTTTGTYMDTISNAAGCDSVITVDLTISNSSASTINPVACDSYTSPSGKYTWTTSDTYMDTITSGSGCNIVLTINLTVNYSTTSFISPMACESYTSPSGKVWTVTGNYLDTIPNSMGCDSLIFVDLTINHHTASTINPVACDSYTSPSGKVKTSSESFMDTIPNTSGCDSVITVNLTINQSSSSTINPVACDSYTSPSGKVKTSSESFVDTIPNNEGCDSLITVNLTINNSNSGIETVSACDSYFWDANSTIYINTGNYSTVLTNQDGCDSTANLDLTINHSNSGIETVSACDSYFWDANSTTYTNTGNYSTVLTNQDGCDSTANLDLTINNSNNGSRSQTACDSYYWDATDSTYTASGSFNTNLTNQDGCDSVATLNLTINNSNSGIETVSACNSYFWDANSTTYTNTGNYSTVLTNQEGCDSTANLDLTINNETASSINATACSSYTSPSGNYTYVSSGVYSDTIPNGAGCHSVITINLVINPVQVTALNLVQAPSGNLIAPLSDGYVINKAAQSPFSVDAVVCSGGAVNSVVFTLNGVKIQTESLAPYAIKGDNPPGNFNAWNPAPGSYTLTATPYSGKGGKGTAGIAKTVNITVVASGPAPDCNGDIGGSAFYDDCNICSGGNTGHVANSDKDDCAVCFGNNANKDCNGDCFGTASIDNCNVCSGGNTGTAPNSTCTVDCNGDQNGTAFLDDCSICSGGNTGHVANSNQDTCGVCFGDNLSCAPCQPLEIIALTLVDVGTGSDIAVLTNGFVIDKSAIGPFSVRADACSQAAIGSVRFYVNSSFLQNENTAPYAIKGDNASGYKPWNPAPGTYTIEARPYSGGNGNGTQGISETVTITITNGPPPADCNGVVGGSAFINDCEECVGGNTGKPANFGKDDCDVCFGNNEDKDCAGVCFGTAAFDNCGDCTGGTTGITPNSSCTVDCNGDVDGTAFLDDCSVCSGGNSGHVANSDKDTCGTCFGNNTSCASCVPNEVVSLTLMNTGKAGPIRVLNAQDTIIKSQLPNFSVRADVCSEPDVESVRFFLNASNIQTESTAPYAIAGDNNGSYHTWNIAAGHYSLTATPYSGNGGTGTVGTSETVDLWILNSAPAASIANSNGSGDPSGKPADQRTAEDGTGTGNTQNGTAALSETDFSLTVEGLALRLFPNPTTGALTVETENAAADSELMLLDMSGKLLKVVTESKVSGAHRSYSLDLADLPKGIYLVKLRSGSEIRTKRVIRE